MIGLLYRGVAQPGSALGLGPRGRWFESNRPDHKLKGKGTKEKVNCFAFAFLLLP